MKKLLAFILLISITTHSAVDEIVSLKLDPRLVHKVYCHQQDSGVSTIIFPAEISGVYAARVDAKFNEKKPNPFLLSFTPGNPHFTIKSLAKAGVKGAVNVIFEGRVYVIHLETVEKGNSSVSFMRPKSAVKSGVGSTTAFKFASPALLLSILDKAKAYHLFKKHYPEQIEDLQYQSPDTVMDYSTHQIVLKEVIRFHSQDVIFFHLAIKNKSDKELLYNPAKFAVALKDKIFYTALSDASGKVPANGTTRAWFCIQASKSGLRNNLDADNDWKVLLSVSQVPKLSSPAKDKKESLK